MKGKDFILGRIVEVVNKTAPSSEVYLFGSRARETAQKDSDWDFLVLLNAKNISFDYETRFLDNLYEIELETGEVLSPLIYSKQEWDTKHSATPLYSNIKKEGIRIK
jgi:predicted nucleotidyltransferase